MSSPNSHFEGCSKLFLGLVVLLVFQGTPGCAVGEPIASMCILEKGSAIVLYIHMEAIGSPTAHQAVP